MTVCIFNIPGIHVIHIFLLKSDVFKFIISDSLEMQESNLHM